MAVAVINKDLSQPLQLNLPKYAASLKLSGPPWSQLTPSWLH